MKYNLESFNDLGRAGFGPNHTFDTDTDHIYECEMDGTAIIRHEIPINKVEDLWPYLWAHPWGSTGGKNYGTDYMYVMHPKPWWESDRDKCWKKFCEERLDAVKEAIRRDNENLGI